MPRPNCELEKRDPRIELMLSTMHTLIDEEHACSGDPSGNANHTHQAPFVVWQSEIEAVMPVSLAPIHSKTTDKKVNHTTVSVDF